MKSNSRFGRKRKSRTRRRTRRKSVSKVCKKCVCANCGCKCHKRKNGRRRSRRFGGIADEAAEEFYEIRELKVKDSEEAKKQAKRAFSKYSHYYDRDFYHMSPKNIKSLIGYIIRFALLAEMPEYIIEEWRKRHDRGY